MVKNHCWGWAASSVRIPLRPGWLTILPYRLARIPSQQIFSNKKKWELLTRQYFNESTVTGLYIHMPVLRLSNASIGAYCRLGFGLWPPWP